jgi:hypothetical protein
MKNEHPIRKAARIARRRAQATEGSVVFWPNLAAGYIGGAYTGMIAHCAERRLSLGFARNCIRGNLKRIR